MLNCYSTNAEFITAHDHFIKRTTEWIKCDL